MIKKVILITIAVLVIGLQFFRGPAPEVTPTSPEDLLGSGQVDAQVSNLLKTACYDCHSNETQYLWYTYITPVSWYVFEHVEEGRKELNFSNWKTLTLRTQLRKLRDIGAEVEKGEMPLASYTLVHGDARLTQEQRKQIKTWADKLSDKLMEE